MPDEQPDAHPGETLHPLLLCAAYLLPTVGTMCFAVWFRDGGPAKLWYWGTKLAMLALPVAILGPGRIVRLFRTTPGVPPRAALRSALEGFWSGAAILGFAALVAQVPWIAIELDAAAERVHARATDLDFVTIFAGIALYVTFVHSTLEEVYWRGFVFPAIRARTRSLHAAHLLAAVGFAANHLVLTLRFFSTEVALLFTACVAIGGWIWTWMAHRHRSLIGAWVSHVLVDAMIMAVAYCWIADGSS